MNIDTDKVDEAVLALLQLGLNEGRNGPQPGESGSKLKHCCGAADRSEPLHYSWGP